MHFYFVVYMPVWGGVVRVPEAVAVPVRFGEIGANHKVLRAEGVKDKLGGIGLGITPEGTGLGY